MSILAYLLNIRAIRADDRLIAFATYRALPFLVVLDVVAVIWIIT